MDQNHPLGARFEAILDNISTEKLRDLNRKCSDMFLQFDSGETFNGCVSSFIRQQLHNNLCDIGKNVFKTKIDDLIKLIETMDDKSDELNKFEQQSINQLFELDSNEQDIKIKSISANLQEIQKLDEKFQTLKDSFDSNKTPKELFFENEIDKNVFLKEKIKSLKSNPLCGMFHINDDVTLSNEIDRLKKATNILSQQNSYRFNS